MWTALNSRDMMPGGFDDLLYVYCTVRQENPRLKQENPFNNHSEINAMGK